VVVNVIDGKLAVALSSLQLCLDTRFLGGKQRVTERLAYQPPQEDIFTNKHHHTNCGDYQFI